jgi:nucleolar protein 4
MSNGVKRRRLSADGEFKVTRSAETLPEPEKPETAVSDSPSKAQRRTLFVRSLPASTTTERLTEFFSQSHPLKHATVVLDPQTKASRGYGFVTFADPEDAQAAAEELNNADLDGRKIKVELAESRHREIAEGGGRSKPSSKAAELKAEREKKRGPNAPPRLIVRNLPWSIKEPEDLEALFRSYGKVKQAVVPNKGPKLQAGFGFVVLRGRKNAEKAIEGVNGKVVDGRQLAVDWAVEKETWEKLQTEGQHAEDSGPGSSASKTQKNGLQKTSLGESEELEPTSEVDIGEGATSSESDKHDIHGIDIEEEVVEGMGSQDDEPKEAPSTTVFIRNLPFTSTDETLQAHFLQFGAVRYARIVFDPETERSRGTGFVCFFDEDNAKSCVKHAPKTPTAPAIPGDKKRRGEGLAYSVLQDEAVDPTGRYTMEGRVLQVSKALSKSDATRREAEGSSKREIRDHDKRRLYLLSEGTISKGSKLYEKLGPTEINIREESTKQRQKLIKNNPSLHVSLTRLSLRNIPRNVSSKDLKALAREAVVGFATDVKKGLRQPLSKEELKRAADSMKEAETLRKQKGKGIVKQAKIVFEGREGAKVDEKSGAGRSRGYGFVEYLSHRAALMGLRWLNGHAVKTRGEERSKRLIVEFAIENARVVAKRKEREVNARTPRLIRTERSGKQGKEQAKVAGKKRKRNDSPAERTKKKDIPKPPIEPEQKNNLAKRNRIIAKKRTMRKSRRIG